MNQNLDKFGKKSSFENMDLWSTTGFGDDDFWFSVHEGVYDQDFDCIQLVSSSYFPICVLLYTTFLIRIKAPMAL